MPAAARAGNSDTEQSEYTRAFDFDDDADDEEDDHEGDEGDVRSGPLALRPRRMGSGLRGGSGWNALNVNT